MINEADNFRGYNNETIELEESPLPVSCRAKEKAVSAYLTSGQIRPFAFADQCSSMGRGVKRLYFSTLSLYHSFYYPWKHNRLNLCSGNAGPILDQRRRRVPAINLRRVNVSSSGIIDHHLQLKCNLYQCINWDDVGPASTTLAQHHPSIGPTPRVC